MEKEFLWKRAVRRSMEQAWREPRDTDFKKACALSAFAIDQARQTVTRGEHLTEAEINRRVALLHMETERMSRRLAATWRTVLVTKR